MPLIYADIGKEVTIKKISSNAEIKQHLNNLGFVQGAKVSLVSILNGSVIVGILNSRIALSRDLAQKIII